MWDLDYWSKDELNDPDTINVTSRVPRTVVQAASRLISNEPEIFSPNYEETAAGAENQVLRQDFLRQLIRAQSRHQPVGLVQSLKMDALILGRMAMQVEWVESIVPETRKTFVPPILMRPLSPLNVGVRTGPLGPEYAYHRYTEKLSSATQRYPGIRRLDWYSQMSERQKNADEEVVLTDFWHIDQEGKVYNTPLISRTRTRNGGTEEIIPVQRSRNSRKMWKAEPWESPYPDLPILLRHNDPMGNQSHSILSGVEETWSTLNMILSMQITALGRMFWPTTYLVSSSTDIDDLEMGEGALNVLPDSDAKFIAPPNTSPAFPLADAVMQTMQKELKDGTFPDSVYGDPGAQRSGYGFTLSLTEGAGRVSETVNQLQELLGTACTLALCFVSKFTSGRSEGVTLYGYDPQVGTSQAFSLTAEQVGSRYDTSVILKTDNANDRAALTMLGLQMYREGLIGWRDFMHDYAPVPPKRDSDELALEEQIFNEPAFRNTLMDNFSRQWWGAPLPTVDQQTNTDPALQPPGDQMLPPELLGQPTGQTMTGNYDQPVPMNQLLATGELPPPGTFLNQLNGDSGR